MTAKEDFEFITFPKTFEKYRWYKPILVFILGAIFYLIFLAILYTVFSAIYGEPLFNTIMNGGYEVMNTEVGQIFSDLGIIIMIPSLFLATIIVKDRPFSSYLSSRGGWNHKLFLKAFIIPFIFFLVFSSIQLAITGFEGTYHFSILYLIILLIFVPLQCIAEECVFRGLIMQTLGSWFKIPVVAVILQGILFGFIHGYNSIGNFEVLILGIIMGFFAWKANGIEVSSAMHTANNLSIALFVMFGLQTTTTNVKMFDVVTSIIMDVALCIILYYVAKKTDWFGEIPENAQKA